MSTANQTPAESSPANVNSIMELPQGADRAEFLKTGDIPETKAKADPPPAKEPPEKGTSVQTEAPASETEKSNQEPKKKGEAARRMEELIEDFKAAGLVPADLKNFKENYQRKEVKTEPVKATEQTAKPVDPKAPVKPKAADFEGKPWEEYEAAKDKYFEDLADYKADQRVQKDRAERQQEASAAAFKTRYDDAIGRYGESAGEVISSTSEFLGKDGNVPAIVRDFAGASPNFAHVMYVLGRDSADFQKFVSLAKSDPREAVIRIGEVERLVKEELAKGSTEGQTERGEDGKFKAPPEKKTAAPPPPKEVSGRGSAPPDAVEDATQAALKTGDSRAAIDAMNREEIRRLKGR